MGLYSGFYGTMSAAEGGRRVMTHVDIELGGITLILLCEENCNFKFGSKSFCIEKDYSYTPMIIVTQVPKKTLLKHGSRMACLNWQLHVDEWKGTLRMFEDLSTSLLILKTLLSVPFSIRSSLIFF